MRRNWNDIHREIDRELKDWTVESLHAIYLKFGSAIVRNAVDRAKLAEIEELAKRIYARKPGLHIYDPDFREETADRVSILELIANPLFKLLRDAVFRAQNYSIHSGACRRIQGTEQNYDWKAPLRLHLDSEFHPFAFTMNHWIPFQDSGKEIAGIQFLPVDYRTTRIFCRFTGHQVRAETRFNFHYFPERPSLEAIEKTFGPDAMLRPKINAGDLVLLSNWIIHGTYRTETMKRGRMNAELRFIGQAIDIAD